MPVGEWTPCMRDVLPEQVIDWLAVPGLQERWHAR